MHFPYEPLSVVLYYIMYFIDCFSLYPDDEGGFTILKRKLTAPLAALMHSAHSKNQALSWAPVKQVALDHICLHLGKQKD